MTLHTRWMVGLSMLLLSVWSSACRAEARPQPPTPPVPEPIAGPAPTTSPIPSPLPPVSVPTPTGSASRATGMVDLHAHVFASAAFSGRWFWGQLEGEEKDALKTCSCDPRTHASAGGLVFREAVSVIPGITMGDTGFHCDKRHGYPHYTGWPRWDTTAHVRYFEGHLKQALDDGLRLMVVQAVESLPLCEQVKKAVTKSPVPLSQVYECDWGDSFKSLERQVALAWDFDRRHEWVEIAKSPAEARRILGETTSDGGKKMVWVLGVEAD